MTGTKPLYEQARLTLEELAKPLYLRAMAAGEGTQAGEQCFELWYELRSIADRINRTHSITLHAGNRESIAAALQIVHELAHDLDIADVPDLTVCNCETKERIVSLGAIFTAYSELMGADNAAA